MTTKLFCPPRALIVIARYPKSTHALRFFSTDRSRTIDSMLAFGEALGVSPNYPGAYTVVPDELNPVRNENCPMYIRDVDDNPHVEEEFESFFAGERHGSFH